MINLRKRLPLETVYWFSQLNVDVKHLDEMQVIDCKHSNVRRRLKKGAENSVDFILNPLSTFVTSVLGSMRWRCLA